jgi:predicted dehydrogenase
LADVQAVEGRRSQGLEVEETVRLAVKSVGGVLGTIDLSWSIDKQLDSYIDIYGTEGIIRVGWRESKYRQSPRHEWVTFGAGYDKVQAFRDQLDNFSRAIVGDEPLRITAADALASVEVVEAAYTSLRDTQWTGINCGGGAGRALNYLPDADFITEARSIG